MNAAVFNDSMQENGDGSDSDTYSEDLPEYYQSISAGNDQDDVSDDESSNLNSGGADSGFHRLPNGYHPDGVGNGISCLDLSDADESEAKSNSTDAEDDEMTAEEQEEMRMREASERAFREDESRRRAPLAAETSSRVMEAMRGVSFTGMAPDWADRVPEEEWINRIRTLAQSQQTTPTTTIQD